jgi:hypothetical protein
VATGGSDPFHLLSLHPDQNTPTPVSSLKRTPKKVTAESFEGSSTGSLPNLLNHRPVNKKVKQNHQPVNKKVKRIAKFLQQVKRSDNDMSQSAQKNELLLGPIGMKEVETEVHQLVFNKNVFKFPNFEDGNYLRRKEIIEKTIEKRVNKSNSHLTAKLLITGEEIEHFFKAFKSLRMQLHNGHKALSSTDVAIEALSGFYKSAPGWKKVYHNRLGINFKASQKWFQEAVDHAPTEINTKSDQFYAERINDCLLAYIHFVDVIITVFPKPTGEAIDRIKVFRTAVTCFGSYTENILLPQGKRDTLRQIKRICNVWKYISNWIANNDNYKLSEVIRDDIQMLNLHSIWKSILFLGTQ